MDDKLVEAPGDLFLSAPSNAILVHACNTRGSWGAGIAFAFKQHFSAAYWEQLVHCNPSARELEDRKTTLAAYQRSLVGTTLLIPLLRASGDDHWKEKDIANAVAPWKRKWGKDDASAAAIPGSGSGSSEKPRGGTPTAAYVACLFTSHSYGRGKDTPASILSATRSALRDLADQIASLPALPSDDPVSNPSDSITTAAAAPQGWVCAMPRINSGLFGVPWEQTRAVLEEVLVPAGVSVLVFVPLGEEQRGGAKDKKRRAGVKTDKETHDDVNDDGDGVSRGKKKVKTPLRPDLTITKEGSTGASRKKRATGMERWLQGQ